MVQNTARVKKILMNEFIAEFVEEYSLKNKQRSC